MRNFDIGSSPTKSFSAYGANSNIKNIDRHNTQKKEKLSEIGAALEMAKNFHAQQDQMKAPVPKEKSNGFAKLGSDERTEIVQNVADEQKKRRHVSFKTDEEIKESLEKAKAQNEQMAPKFDQNSKTEDILNGVLNDLF